jgi:hypothetical protein
MPQQLSESHCEIFFLSSQNPSKKAPVEKFHNNINGLFVQKPINSQYCTISFNSARVVTHDPKY